jgi:hypothetical protein
MCLVSTAARGGPQARLKQSVAASGHGQRRYEANVSLMSDHGRMGEYCANSRAVAR